MLCIFYLLAQAPPNVASLIVASPMWRSCEWCFDNGKDCWSCYEVWWAGYRRGHEAATAEIATQEAERLAAVRHWCEQKQLQEKQEKQRMKQEAAEKQQMKQEAATQAAEAERLKQQLFNKMKQEAATVKKQKKQQKQQMKQEAATPEKA